MGDKAKGLVIVCSTTGNGDAPENCDGWWRSTKLRSAAKDLFQDVPYTVLGLGDTNYDKFCHMGKIIDKRLAELGGKKFMDGTWVDEATGLEEPIEAWKIKVFDLVMSINDDTFQWPNSEAAVEGATEAVKSLTIESAAETTAQKEAESAPAPSPAPLPTA
jgi:sulfite reductase alpha subunit-like flavoprotein